MLILGVVANLAALAYFKYAIFIAENTNTLLSTNYNLGKIILPLAISFFTFQQITFLVDAFRNQISDYKFSHYCLFVLFFPQLIAGPIVHHKEMMPQFIKNTCLNNLSANFNAGLTLFTIGLFKKVVLADSLARIADPAFKLAESGQHLSLPDAWSGALAYSFQLYFDFSGYSEMAIGIAILFGIKLPLNFFSPYKSKNIIEFWKRWHITLSRFLRDYLYIPLGGNRLGTTRRYSNLLITMLLGGIWHGAGWTFIIWGGLHGLFLIVNHGWRAASILHNNQLFSRANKFASPLLTFFCVVIAWVYFRAESVEGAHHMLRAMFDFKQLELSKSYLREITQLPLFQLIRPFVEEPKLLSLCATITSAGVIVFFFPNTVEFMQKHHPALYPSDTYCLSRSQGFTRWQASPAWSIVITLCLCIALVNLSRVSPFLYFQF